MQEFHFLLGLEGATFIRFHFIVEAPNRKEAVTKANELIEANWGGLDADSFDDECTGFSIYFGSQVRASENDIVEESDLMNMHQAEMNRHSAQLYGSAHAARSE